MTRPLPQPVRIYRVGGSVRDELLERPVSDRDWVVVGAAPEIMLASGFRPVGKDFPVFLHPETRDEYALARTERKHGRGHRGFQFFATPEVTLEEDLRRRDLTINAMARAPDGQLIDPYGGEADLRAGVLRHVSPAFAEDPLRVLRVARFAARFDFRIADETLALMRCIVAARELETLAPERVWRELARGLCEAHPSRMLDALRACNALVELLPELDALYAILVSDERLRDDNAGAFTARALDWSAVHALTLPARYAVLTQELDRVDAAGGRRFDTRAGISRVEAVSKRLRVPLDCRDVARLAVRWHRVIADVEALTPAALLDLLLVADALRRPDRLDALAAAAAAHVVAHDVTEASGARAAEPTERERTALLHEALAVVRTIDAATIAREAIARAAQSDRSPPAGAPGDAIASALRAARIGALRDWKVRKRGGKA
ncbi:MAG: multifunctional CCA tRNA nucleotidyl transferase/2'3'-cyclic phosphodiesterase/2'nucleotidase/phosphatase [Casimicrobiaceae bacterium]